MLALVDRTTSTLEQSEYCSTWSNFDVLSPPWYTHTVGRKVKMLEHEAKRLASTDNREISHPARSTTRCAYNEDIWSKEGPGGGQWKIQSIEPIKEPDSKVRVRVHGASLCIHDGGRGRPRTRDLQRCFPRFLVDWGNERGDALIVRQWYLGFSPSLWNQKEANWLPLGVQDKA